MWLRNPSTACLKHIYVDGCAILQFKFQGTRETQWPIPLHPATKTSVFFYYYRYRYVSKADQLGLRRIVKSRHLSTYVTVPYPPPPGENSNFTPYILCDCLISSQPHLWLWAAVWGRWTEGWVGWAPWAGPPRWGCSPGSSPPGPEYAAWQCHEMVLFHGILDSANPPGFTSKIIPPPFANHFFPLGG